MNKLVAIGTAAKALGVSTSTLRRWETKGRLRPARTEGGQRRYHLAALFPQADGAGPPCKTVAYGRVSSRGQKQDLDRQQQVLELYCTGQDEILADKIGRLVLTHKDRLLRFGAELVFAICQAKGVEVVIINLGEDSSFEEDLASDVLELVTVFSAKLYGSRSHKNQKLIDGMRQAAKEAQCS